MKRCLALSLCALFATACGGVLDGVPGEPNRSAQSTKMRSFAWLLQSGSAYRVTVNPTAGTWMTQRYAIDSRCRRIAPHPRPDRLYCLAYDDNTVLYEVALGSGSSTGSTKLNELARLDVYYVGITSACSLNGKVYLASPASESGVVQLAQLTISSGELAPLASYDLASYGVIGGVHGLTMFAGQPTLAIHNGITDQHWVAHLDQPPVELAFLVEPSGSSKYIYGIASDPTASSKLLGGINGSELAVIDAASGTTNLLNWTASGSVGAAPSGQAHDMANAGGCDALPTELPAELPRR
ncbi:MAG: hypothetical protein H6707_04200 [Deltaproteobacteria bacterium]|nr:hypothetical protein [Deltaproteobacteria bacterium]